MLIAVINKNGTYFWRGFHKFSGQSNSAMIAEMNAGNATSVLNIVTYMFVLLNVHDRK